MTINAKTEMNMKDFAMLCGVTTQALRLWVQEGMPGQSKPCRNATYYDVAIAIPWVRDNKWKPALDDRARLDRIKADNAELDLALKMKTLCRVEDIRKQWGEECATMRARLLSIPHSDSSLNQVQRERLRDEIHEALAALSGVKSA